jgi:hypothetical protein
VHRHPSGHRCVRQQDAGGFSVPGPGKVTQ